MTMNSQMHDFELPTQEEIESCIADCRRVIGELKEQSWEIDKYRTEFILAAEGIIVVAEMLAKFGKYELKRVSNTQEFLKRYRESWMASNKESELYRLEKLFAELDAL